MQRQGYRMAEKNATSAALWDAMVQQAGHTGYRDDLVYKYDQPIRLKLIQFILSKLIPHDAHEWTLLDLGCGTGDFIDLAYQLGASKVVGVDVSQNVLSIAKQRFKSVGNVELRQGTVVEALETNETFDLITSVTVLQHHVTDAELLLALSRIRKCLKPGGAFIALEISFQNRQEDLVMKHDDIPYLIERSGASWRRLFERAGFELQPSPTMPQLGIFALRKFAAAITFLLYGDGTNAKDPMGSEAKTSTKVKTLGVGQSKVGLKTTAYLFARKLILSCSFIFDHLLKLPLPPRKVRSYEVFILRSSPN